MESFALNTLYIVRHGIAEEGFGKPDAQRELTQEGRDKMHINGTRLRDFGVQPGLIIASPYTRAQQTASILAQTLGYGGEIMTDDRITPMGRYEGLSDLFSEVRSQQNIMVVSHEPAVSGFVSGICADNRLRIDFKKGAIACIAIERFRPLQGSLLWYVTSGTLKP
jgi:phosphohistidine phosphatase